MMMSKGTDWARRAERMLAATKSAGMSIRRSVQRQMALREAGGERIWRFIPAAGLLARCHRMRQLPIELSKKAGARQVQKGGKRPALFDALGRLVIALAVAVE